MFREIIMAYLSASQRVKAKTDQNIKHSVAAVNIIPSERSRSSLIFVSPGGKGGVNVRAPRVLNNRYGRSNQD